MRFPYALYEPLGRVYGHSLIIFEIRTLHPKVARVRRFELPTVPLGGAYSIQLSYTLVLVYISPAKVNTARGSEGGAGTENRTRVISLEG